MNMLHIYTLSGVSVLAMSGALVRLGSNKKTPEQRETLRRQRINEQGRITDGTVLDVRETDSDSGPTQMVLYAYDVAGVHYECAQDLTHLRPVIDLRQRHLGVSTSVKFDSHHPGNSIVAAETWCGLRTTLHSPHSPHPAPDSVSTPSQ